jgi:putative DNA primase/helicase
VKKRSVTELFDPEIVAEVDEAFPSVATIGMALTDLGNAERLVSRFRDRIRYCPPRRKWIVWGKQRWRWDETGIIERLAKRTIRAGYAEAEHARSEEQAKAIAKHFTKSEDVARIAAMIKHASTEEGIPVMPDELDADPWLLNCANGTIELQTGKLREHRKSDLITRLVGVNFDPSARHELWEKFLDEATGGDAELRAFLQRMAGYCATGCTSEKHFFFVYSKKPDTGKSTFADALRASLGDYAADADFDTWLEQSHTGGNRGDVARLAGARLVISVEVRKRAKFDAHLVKAITGGDPITCAAKYESEFTYRPAFKILLAANAAPVIHDDDRPLFERCLRVPFDVQIPAARKNKAVKERLSDQADAGPAILAWIVQGALEWQKQALGVPAAVRRSSEAYQSEMNTFSQFLLDVCKFEGRACVAKKEFREAYEAWCKENGVKYPLSARDVMARLGDHNVTEGSTGKIRFWRGVRLRTEDDPPTDTTDKTDTFPRNFSTREKINKVYGNDVSSVSRVSGKEPADSSAETFPESNGFHVAQPDNALPGTASPAPPPMASQELGG